MRGLAIRYVLTGLGVIGLSVLLGHPLVIASSLLFGGFFIWIGVTSLRLGSVVQLSNTAFNELARGNVLEAEAILDEIAQGPLNPLVRRAVALQRSLIAMSRGDAVRAEAEATKACEGRPGVFSGAHERVQMAAGFASRAMARATQGNGDGARADAQVALASPDAAPEALARATLAQAVLLARADERVALGDLLDRNRTLLVEASRPRERALVRALQRMVKARASSAYREPGRREELDEHGQPGLQSWVAQVAPGAAPFVREAGTTKEQLGDLTPEGPPPSSAMANIKTAHAAAAKAQRPGKQVRRVVALWLVLVGLFVLIWRLLDDGGRRPGHRPPSPPVDTGSAISLFLTGLFVLAGVAISVAMRRQSTQSRAMLEGLRHMFCGDFPAAETTFRRLTTATAGGIAAQAFLQLAYLEERKGQFERALSHVNDGIGRATKHKAHRGLYADILLPDLHAQRAVALLGVGREGEAFAELALLAREFPAYPFAARAQLRVQLLAASRRGDTEAATLLAKERTPDLPLPARDEFLADLLLVRAGGGGAGDTWRVSEVERLRGELHGDGDLRAWLAVVGPGLEGVLVGADTASAGLPPAVSTAQQSP